MRKPVTAPSGPPKPLFDRSEDQAYFKAIEALFIELRGAPFQLSPDDFKISKTWRVDGVPLDVALSTLRERFAKAMEKGEEPKRRLGYYRRAVESAWQRQRELAAPGAAVHGEDLDVAARLARLAKKVPRDLDPIRRKVTDLNPGDGAEAIDRQLDALDEEMLVAVRRALTEEQQVVLDQRVEAGMAALAGRLGGASPSARQRAEIRLLRDLANLPMLSLFSPDALDD